MNDLEKALYELRENDPDVKLVLDAFGEIDRAYMDALEAMGFSRKATSGVSNSAEVTTSFCPTASTADI